jgi:hypothetical protein
MNFLNAASLFIEYRHFVQGRGFFIFITPKAAGNAANSTAGAIKASCLQELTRGSAQRSRRSGHEPFLFFQYRSGVFL